MKIVKRGGSKIVSKGQSPKNGRVGGGNSIQEQDVGGGFYMTELPSNMMNIQQ